jgi:hypothetical protein
LSAVGHFSSLKTRRPKEPNKLFSINQAAAGATVECFQLEGTHFRRHIAAKPWKQKVVHIGLVIGVRICR